jgi:hypothetical protein
MSARRHFFGMELGVRELALVLAIEIVPPLRLGCAAERVKAAAIRRTPKLSARRHFRGGQNRNASEVKKQ